MASKVRLVTQLRVVTLADRARAVAPVPPPPPDAVMPALASMRVVAIGASTGGPPAVQRILAGLDARAPVCVLVAQHLPPAFTTSFAERLDRLSFEVREGRTGRAVPAGADRPAAHMEVERGAGGLLRVRISAATPTTAVRRSMPLTSTARVAGPARWRWC